MPLKIVKVNGLQGTDREAVLYCGRAWAGWKESPWHNPYRIGRGVTREMCLDAFREYANAKPLEWWQALFVASGYGELPLGCWCIDSELWDGQPVICHCQILADGIERRLSEGLLSQPAKPTTNRPTRRGGK